MFQKFVVLALFLSACTTSWAESIEIRYRGELGAGFGIFSELNGFPVEGTITVDSELADRYYRIPRYDTFSSGSSRNPPGADEVWQITFEIPEALPRGEYEFSTGGRTNFYMEILDGRCIEREDGWIARDRFFIYADNLSSQGTNGMDFSLDLTWENVDGINPGMEGGNLLNAVPYGLAMDLASTTTLAGGRVSVHSDGRQLGGTSYRLLDLEFPQPPQAIERRQTCPVPPPNVVNAVLPTSRSVSINEGATAFATLINTSVERPVYCGLSLTESTQLSFSYQSTDPMTNEVIGDANAPVWINPESAQSFVFTIASPEPIVGAEIPIYAKCDGLELSTPIPGVSTLVFSASSEPVPDLIALAATDTGILDLPHSTMTGVFVVATANVGVGAEITMTADTGDATLPLSFLFCETDPTTSACVNPNAPSENPVTTYIETGETPTFAVFAFAEGDVDFDPAVNRVFVRFRDDGGEIRGSTSVAVRTIP